MLFYLFIKKIKFLAKNHDQYIGFSTREIFNKLILIANKNKISVFSVVEQVFQITRVNSVNKNYSSWISYIENLSLDVVAGKLEVNSPVVSVILLGSPESNKELFIQSLGSLQKQTMFNWELIVVTMDDGNFDKGLQDKRIKIYPPKFNCCFFQTINSVLDNCTGKYITFLKAGDQLSKHTVSFLSGNNLQNLQAKLIVTDEDVLDNSGKRQSPFFKPDWNPDYLLNYNYFSKAVVYEKQFLKELGGFNISVNDPYHDLALRATQQLADAKIHHISHVLFHFKQSNDNRGEVVRVKYDVPLPTPLVSIIIPTKDQLSLLKDCVDGVLNETRYKNVEIIIVDNQSELSETLHYFNELRSTYKNIRILHYDKPFNYSDMNNTAVSEARGDVIVFLNNDVSVIGENNNTVKVNHDDDWLTEMVSQACRAEIGCVGAKLFYPDGTIQHGGVILGLKGCASHAHKGFEGDSTGYFNRLIAVHNVSAVTAACMAVRKEVFEKVGGFDAVNLKVAYNDVDLCLKVREAGYRNLFTPYAELIHHESKSRGKKHKRKRKDAKKLRKEAEYLKKKWGDQLFTDPAYNKNLTLLTEDFALGLRREDH